MMQQHFPVWSGGCATNENAPHQSFNSNRMNAFSLNQQPQLDHPGAVGDAWAHKVPQAMPWGGGPSPFQPPDPCTSKTATSWELLNHHFQPSSPTSQCLKRKGDSSPKLPHKQCITEEHMAARFQEMHITNTFRLPNQNPTTNFGISPKERDTSITNLKQLEVMINDKTTEESCKSIILAPELKKLIEPEKIFARTFPSRVERPSMALVLWEPGHSRFRSLGNSVFSEASHNTLCNNNSFNNQTMLSSKDNLTDEIMET